MFALLFVASLVADWPATHAACRPVPLRNVRAEGFLGRRVQANVRSILAGLESPIPRRFEARARGAEPGPETNRLAADSDLFKWIEGAAYAFAATGDAVVGRELERVAGLVIACQQPDGYINTQVPPNRRFDDKVNHDLYSAGHLFEAAVAHHRATGKRHLLDAAARWADYLIGQYRAGNPYFQTVARREHSEYELGLLRLYRATSASRYLDFSQTLTRLIPVGPALITGRHAVRTNYLLAGYADLYLETGRTEFIDGIEDLWREIRDTRSFLTGGVSVHERYQDKPHYLPGVTSHERRDIAETCTSISLMMLGWRLHSRTPDSRFFDRIETILYNHALGAVSLDHLGTFYYNPLRMIDPPPEKTDHDGPVAARTRLPAVHSTACCITNEWRFFAALPEYLYSYDDRGLYVNLYTSGSVQQRLANGTEAAISVTTNYPHDGRIALRIAGSQTGKYALRVRIPEWAAGATVAVNTTRPVEAKAGTYAEFTRVWKPGDTVVLRLPMTVRMIVAAPRDTENAGRAALVRGPLVYCAEQDDNRTAVGQTHWNLRPEEASRVVKARWEPALLGGVYTLTAPATPSRLTLIPFYARANRTVPARWIVHVPLRSTNGQLVRVPQFAIPSNRASVFGLRGRDVHRIPARVASRKDGKWPRRDSRGDIL
jgi:uncharacterized protein